MTIKLPDWAKKILRLNYYVEFEVTTDVYSVFENMTIDGATRKFSSIAFMVPKNTGTITYCPIRVKGLTIYPGDGILSFLNEAKNKDITKYDITFVPVAGGIQSAFYITKTANEGTAKLPKLEDC